MRLLQSLFSPNGTTTGPAPRVEQDQSGYAELYEMLWSLYHSDIYDELPGIMATQFEGVNIHAIRNPTFRTVEFYGKQLWPGALPDALPIEAENERIIENVHELWKWSNWASKKQVFARQYALLGNPFIKVAGREDRQRVYFQLPDPGTVTDFDTDERDNITYIRLDIPIDEADRFGDTTRRYWVEVWDKDDETYRQWITDQRGRPIDELGTPRDETPLRDFGIDFVPFVYAKFRDIGDVRGVGAVTMALRKIWEADLIATSLHQRLFRYNKPDWVLTSAGQDSAGRASTSIKAMIAGGVIDDSGMPSVNVGEENLWDLPPGRDLRSLVANVDYRSALAILQAHMQELESDLPELAWYKLREMNQVSGRAVRMLLSDPIANALEARGNAEHALAKANMMGLTMMRNYGLTNGDIGSFERGDFEHTFKHRDIIPLNEQELAETEYQQALGDAVLVNQLGYSKQYIQHKRGLDAETIEQMSKDRDTTGDEVGASILRMFDSGNVS